MRNYTLVFFVILVALSGCRLVRSEISSFSSLSPTSYGESFYVLPSDNQKTSAEFSQYSNSVSRRLSQKGWFRVSNPSDARYIVLLDYGVSGSTEKSFSTPIYGQTGGGTTSHSGTFNTYGSGYGSNTYGSYSGTPYQMPTWGVVGSQSHSYTHYQRYFQMKIIEKANETAVYETKAASSGSSATFGAVAECIFDLALNDFPRGSSGTDTIMMDDCGG